MGNALQDKTVLVVGRGSGIARAVVLLAQSEGARVIVAGRDQAKLASAYGHPDLSAEAVDITDDESIAALADRVGGVDHVVSTASARARGKLADLQRENLLQSFDTKVIGPTMMAKYFAPQINPGGSFVLFSGVHAFKLNVGYLGVGITNRADTGQRDFTRSYRYRRLGRYGRRRQAGLLQTHRGQQPGRSNRNPRRHCQCGAVRDDQH